MTQQDKLYNSLNFRKFPPLYPYLGLTALVVKFYHIITLQHRVSTPCCGVICVLAYNY